MRGIVLCVLCGCFAIVQVNADWPRFRGPNGSGVATDRGLPALLYQNVLYTIRSGILSLYEPETGKLLRQERLRNALGDYYASPVAADGKLYFVSHEGKITVVKAGAEAQILSTGELGEEVIATPAIAEGRIYLRTEETLFCFGIRKNGDLPRTSRNIMQLPA